MNENKIGMQIRILAILIGRHFNEVGINENCLGLTGPQGLVLGYLYEHLNEEVFQKDIELMFNIRRSSATGLLKCLENNGFIKRVKVDYDARLKKIVLTKKALNYSELLEASIKELESDLTKGLQPEEIEAFIKTILKMKSNLE